MKLLLVKISALGDVLAFSPIPRLIKQVYPDTFIIHAVMNNSSQVTISNPYIDQYCFIPTFPKPNIFANLYHYIQAIFSILSSRSDKAILYHRNPLLVFLLFLSGVRDIYTYAKPSSLFNFLFRSYSHLDYDSSINRTLMDCSLTSLLLPELSNPDSLDYFNVATSISYQIPQDHSYISFSIGGGNFHSEATNRIWPPSYYSQLADLLFPIKIVLLGYGSSDSVLASSILSTVKNPGSVTNLVSKLQYSETAYVISRAKLHIGNDSSLLFLASALDTPFVGIYGPTSPSSAFPFTLNKKSFPIASHVTCSPCYDPYESLAGKMYTCKNNYCMQTISPRQIFNSISHLL